jgi:predicted anti-sigma-YlaC factor YlaD
MARYIIRSLALLTAATLLTGCGAVKKMAINQVGNTLAESGTTYSSDDDPELVAAAVPFGLKTIEGLLASSPDHKGLLLAACSGFTQYAYAFVQQPADYIEATDLEKATEMRARAKKLFLRARDYGLRGFDAEKKGFSARLRTEPDAELATLTKKQVPLLYYTGAAWAAAFAVDVTDSSLATDQTVIEKMMRRALALDEAWGDGSIHDFFISWEAAHASAGGSVEKAREHFERSRQLSAGKRVSPLVSYAESVLTGATETAAAREKSRKEFEALLNETLRFDVEKGPPDSRLANVIAQRRAKWLLGRADELF